MRHIFFWCGVVLLASWVSESWTADILYISTTASPSHNIWDKTLAMALHQKGHRITYVTHSPEKSFDNFTTIILEGVYEKMHADFVVENFADYGPVQSMDVLFEWLHAQSTYDAETNGLQRLIKLADDGKKFDLILWDLTSNHFLYPIINKFENTPTVGTSPFGLISYFTFPFGIDVYTPYMPLWMLPYTDKMTLLERIQNYLYTMMFLYKRQYVYLPKQKLLAEKVFGENTNTNLADIEKRFTMLLSNSDPVLDYPQPVPPGIIQVGGLHTKREKALPQDIQKFMDESNNGVILFCLGTNVQSDQMKIEKKNALIKALSKLKQNVIWKYESEISDLPKNILVRKFVPQNDILAHPNVKLFITHGGALSTQEAVFHGVPVVGIPFFADQYINVHKMVNRKLGLSIDYNSFTSEEALSTINEVIYNPQYKNNIKVLSRRYRDQPQDALDRAVFWVEYAIRNKGAEHLRIAARDMPLYQLYFLDMWGIIVIMSLLTGYSIFFFIFSKTKNMSSHKSKMN